ncbi:MAG TPA: hypothetical protein VJ747_12970 [Stellaceae bacterium]|nr:hypothetical protein [Stellaceae bacterium]
MHWAIQGALRWAGLTGLYVVLAGQLSISEMTAGLLTGLAAAALSLALRAAAEQRFRPRAPWHRLGPRLLLAVLRDVNRVAVALAKAMVAGRAGTIQSQPIAPIGEGAAEAGHRALAMLLVSVAPNGYVLESRRAELTLHRLAEAAPAADRLWPL